jgi:hypothetical protein
METSGKGYVMGRNKKAAVAAKAATAAIENRQLD